MILPPNHKSQKENTMTTNTNTAPVIEAVVDKFKLIPAATTERRDWDYRPKQETYKDSELLDFMSSSGAVCTLGIIWVYVLVHFIQQAMTLTLVSFGALLMAAPLWQVLLFLVISMFMKQILEASYVCTKFVWRKALIALHAVAEKTVDGLLWVKRLVRR